MQFQKKFLLVKNSVSYLTKLLLKYCALYTSVSSQLLIPAHILDQLLNIVTKIVMVNSSSSSVDISKIFFDANLHVALMQLISTSNDLCLIHGSLNLFIYLVSNADNKVRLVNDLDISDQLLLMLQEYDEDSKKFASKLLSSLCSEEKIKFEITHLDGEIKSYKSLKSSFRWLLGLDLDPDPGSKINQFGCGLRIQFYTFGIIINKC
jgi:hypothetical protein